MYLSTNHLLKSFAYTEFMYRFEAMCIVSRYVFCYKQYIGL